MFRFEFLDIYGGTIGNCMNKTETRAYKVDEFSFDLYFNLQQDNDKNRCEDFQNLIDKVCLEINENFNTSQILIDGKSSKA